MMNMKTILRKLIILGDIAIFGLLVWLGIEENPLNEGALSALFYFVVLILIIGNLYMILFMREADDWLSLFLKRKALEEKKKIADLEVK